MTQENCIFCEYPEDWMGPYKPPFVKIREDEDDTLMYAHNYCIIQGALLYSKYHELKKVLQNFLEVRP